MSETIDQRIALKFPAPKTLFLIVQKQIIPLQDLRIRYTAPLENPRISASLKASAMSDKSNLLKVKTALAEKYERLSRSAKSVPKTRQFSCRAVRYRRQVAQMLHGSDS